MLMGSRELQFCSAHRADVVLCLLWDRLRLVDGPAGSNQTTLEPVLRIMLPLLLLSLVDTGDA